MLRKTTVGVGLLVSLLWLTLPVTTLVMAVWIADLFFTKRSFCWTAPAERLWRRRLSFVGLQVIDPARDWGETET